MDTLEVMKKIRHKIEWRLAPPPAFVVVGTGRCGTGYTAALLTNIGISCGHETVYTPHGKRKRFGVRGDASYLAVPHLDRFRGAVIHQVRDPIMVINSLIGTKFFERGHDDKYLIPVCQRIDLTGEPRIDAVRYVVRWNAMCARHADVTIRVEDLPEGIESVLTRLDLRPRWRARRVQDVTAVAPSSNVNSRNRGSISSWDDLPDTQDKSDLFDFATRHGYVASSVNNAQLATRKST